MPVWLYMGHTYCLQEAESNEEGEEVEEKGRRKALKPPGAAGAKKAPQQRKPPAIQTRPAVSPLDQQPLGSPTSPMSPTTRAAVKQVR